MANTRSGGAYNDEAGDTGAGTSATKDRIATKAKEPKSARTSTSSDSARESKSSSMHESSDTQKPNLRRSNRETKGKKSNLTTTAGPASTPVKQKSTKGSGSTDNTLKSSVKKLRVAESKTGAPRTSNRVKYNRVLASSTPNDSSGNSSPPATPSKTTKRQIDDTNSVKNKVDNTQSASRQTKKQKRLSAKSYAKLFVISEVKAKSPVLATPLRGDEGNASKVHMEENGSVLGYEESDPYKQDNKAHLGQIVDKFCEGYTSGLPETPDVILETDALRTDVNKFAPTSEAHMPTDLCSQDDASENSLATEAREQIDIHSNKSLVPEPPNSPSSTVHSKEAKNAVEDSDSVGIRGACSSKLTDLCSQDDASENSLATEAREQTDIHSNKSLVPEPPNSPSSTVHSKEAKNAVEDSDSVGIRGACSSKLTEVTQYDDTECKKHMCVVCRSAETPGIIKSCYGRGCKRKYHLSCLDLPLECVSLGIWLCSICTKQRLLFGVYSVSESVESLWDVKDGVQNCKQYFVKYMNLAHVHNRWVPESNIMANTPGGHDLLSRFNKKVQKDKTIRWKQEWAEPHRLLKKRSLMPLKEAEEFFNSVGDNLAFCNVEWLVKWKDLGYEHATWELETSSFLCTPEAEELKRSYENRHEAARKASDTAKINKVKKSPFLKLLRLPDGFPPGLDNDYLLSLNQLREFWHNSCGAILVDDQERVIKTIHFATSILPDVCRPLLIVSTSASLMLWEAKFNRLAPSINVVVYNGEKDVRKTIQDLEFYDNGSVMLQVLLSHPDAILEDIETMECIDWETVIVDDCQSSRVSKCLEQLKRLHTDFRMVLLSSPLKENIPDYINLLSFLKSEAIGISGSSDVDSSDTAGTLAMLKSKLMNHIAFERKADSSKFLEYWVPARLSRVQLEMYCYTLLSSSSALRSHSKTDSVGALRDILVSLRKCCDHPYLVDQSLQVSLIKGHPPTDILDIGVNASGKLLLLDKMLQEIRGKGLRVLILSQSGGGSGNPMGDILDDFLRQRFGFESYERVERGLQVLKRQTAMSMFNDKTKGRFIFLIDSRACVPSIKLSSVDVIITYCSDWNPTNDLRVLQRISIGSQSERVPIFRLYSSYTVEEKALILAKHDIILDNNIQNITPILSHSLISWGASFLFNRLEELKNNNYSSKDSDGDKLFIDGVLLEFITKLSTEVDASTKVNSSAISRAYVRGSSYSRESVVVGEMEGISAVDGDLPKFWSFWLNLLDGKFPRWQYITEPAQRCRRKVQHMQEEEKICANEADEASRIKRRKIGETIDSSPNVLAGKDKAAMLPGNNEPSNSHQISVDDTWQELGEENLCGTQKGLHVQLKPELSKLYQLLELPESVKCLCEEFLDYVLKNHQVSQEPKGILHAFNIALCWRAASLLKHKIDRRESLALAAKHLNYECNEGLADFVYEKLRILKKKFSCRAGKTSKYSQSTSVNNISPYLQETSTKLAIDESVTYELASVDATLQNGSYKEAPHDLLIEMMVPGEKEPLSVPETHAQQHLSKDVLLNRITEKRLNLVDMVFSLREKNIHDKQADEIAILDMRKQKEVVKLREVSKLVVEHLRRTHTDPEDRDSIIKLITEWFTLLLCVFLEHMSCQRKKLDMQQSCVWTNELQLKENFRQEAKSGQLDDTFDQHVPLPASGFVLEEFSHFSCFVDTATLTNCPRSLDDTSEMEIALVQSVLPSRVISQEAAIDGSAEIHICTEGEPSSEGIGVTENTANNFDGIDSQGGGSLAVQHLLSSNLAIDNSIDQESSIGVHKIIEHVEGEGGVGSRPLMGGTNKQLGDGEMEVSIGNVDNTLADPPHIEPLTVAPVPRQAALPLSREVETQTGVAMQSAQPTVALAQLLLQGEAGQTGLSGAARAQPLQSVMQPSTSSEVETPTDLVIRSTQQSLEQSHSQPLQGKAELAGLSGIVSTQPLQPEMQPTMSMEVETQTGLIFQSDQRNVAPAQHLQGEVEQGGFSCVPSARPSLPEMLPSAPVSNIPLERTPADWSQPSQQSEATSSSAQSTQFFPLASMMFNHPPVGDEPLRNELHRLRLHVDSLNKVHELKQSQLRTECSQEVEKIKQKYDLLLEEQESTHLQQRKTLDDLCEKVLLNQSLADDFRAKFISSSAAQARAPSPSTPPGPPVSQQIPSVTLTALPIASLSAARPQLNRPSSSVNVSCPSSPSLLVARSHPSMPSNLVRSTSAPFSQMPPRGGYGVQSELARAPAPHLQRRLPPRAHSMVPANQQMLTTTRPDGTSARTQSAATMSVNVRPSSSHTASPVNPSSSSLHSSSLPVIVAPLLPSSSHPTHQVLHVPSILNPALRATAQIDLSAASSVSSAASGQHSSMFVGPSVPGMHQSVSDSASLDAWLTKNLGLSDDIHGAAARTNVVCLSDDE